MSTESQPRQRDAERTRAEILDVATAEFAERGLAARLIDRNGAVTTTAGWPAQDLIGRAA